MADLPSILGGLAQGFVDFGKGAVDMFGTGGAAIGDLIEGARTGKVTTKNQDDFRKWLYQTDSTKDAAAKGLGTALNGVQTVLDYIPGVNVLTRNPLGNAAQGALGGLADEFKTYGEDYDLGRAGQRAAVSGAAAAASGSLADALKGSSNALLSSNTLQGLARGATGGAITGGGYAAIDGGDVLEAAKQGAGMGALIGGATGAFQDFKPAKTYDVALTDDERAARIANAQKQIDDIGPIRRFTDDPNELAKRARVNELQDAIKAYQSGYDTVQDYNDALAARRANRQPSLTREEYEAKMQQRIRDLGGNYEVTPEKQAQFDRLQKVNPMRDDYHTGIRAPQDIATLQEAINNAKDIDPAYKAMLQKALADDSVTVYSSYPIEEGVFTTPIKQMAQDYAGPGNQVYSKTISPNDIAWIDDQEGNYIPRLQQLETTLSNADMAVNNPRYLTDENGNPRTFYHGSPNKNITEFDINQAGKNTSSGEHALYFTDSPEVADEFSYERLPSDSMFVDNRGAKGRVYPVNLAMDNPLDLSNLSDKQIEELWQYASPLGKLDGKEKFIKNMKAFRDYGNDQLIKTNLDLDKLANSPYDGFTARMYPNQDNQAREYAVFDNSKIKMLEDVLANDDMAVNSAKIAPGQLGLFDDMPTQTPKTGTRQTSLFDQPDNPYLDYYGADIDAAPLAPETPANPYAPVNGEVTQAMRDRASEIIDNLALKKQIPDNELFNKIDPATLPKGQQKIGEFLDQAYAKGLTHGDITDMMRETVSNEFDKRLGKTPNKEKLISFIFGNADETAKKEMMDKELGLYIAPETVSEGTLSSMAKHKISSEIYGDNLSALTAGNRTLRGGYTGALDSVLSERLGIAPGNTYKKTGTYDTGGSYGRYQEYTFNPNKNNIMVRTALDNEDAVNTMAHERLHSFQTEAKKLYDRDRYSPEVKDAYDELAKDLKDAKAYRTGKEIKNRYGSDVAYWRHHDEQEARMLQQYLDAKGYTGSRHHNENQYLGLEFDDAKITPAFDKFFDKLRDLSKRGVALPALAALFGGGAYMASQENDKEKEVK